MRKKNISDYVKRCGIGTFTNHRGKYDLLKLKFWQLWRNIKSFKYQPIKVQRTRCLKLSFLFVFLSTAVIIKSSKKKQKIQGQLIGKSISQGKHVAKINR